MGATEEHGVYASSHEKPVHRVRVNDFYMMESVVTQELWEAVMGSNPSIFKGKVRPVTNVSYYDCCEFINKINRHLKIGLRLPTEKEWEYAARGGCKRSDTMYSGSANLGDVAWYIENSNSVIHDVKLKRPNKLGLYDMSGNVWEWCATKNKSYSCSYINHSNWYINRGGCATSQESGCRTSRRYCSHPNHKSCFLGFRLVI
jgi:formylglycine-generating enzyme required for sulfatase activity